VQLVSAPGQVKAGTDLDKSFDRMDDPRAEGASMYDRLKQIEKLREGFTKNGWTFCHQLFPPEIAAASLKMFERELGNTRETYTGIWDKGPFTDKFCFESYAYGFPFQAAMLWTLTPYMQALTGKEILPTTSYFRVYRKGDICKLHMDRAAAEYAISLTLGYSDDISWPLWLSEQSFEPNEDQHSQAADIPPGSKLSMFRVPMEPGDAVFYDGVRKLHGRNDPNPNEWSAHVFFNFIERDGAYADQAFDRRADNFVLPSEFIFPDDDGPKKTKAKKKKD
jgi:hypothetical protein